LKKKEKQEYFLGEGEKKWWVVNDIYSEE